MNIAITDTSQTTTYTLAPRRNSTVITTMATDITEPSQIGTSVYLDKTFGQYENE